MLATQHIRHAKQLCKDLERSLEDKDLAYFLQDDDGYQGYIDDMLWAQRWALANRDEMLSQVVRNAASLIGGDTQLKVLDTIKCHHNYAELETHEGVDIWVTRKGAIRAQVGDRGIIPGSMGTATYIVEGKGNSDSYNSASHGAGRRMSRTEAKKNVSEADLSEMMAGKTWLSGSAAQLVDEAPAAYKDIEAVMVDQSDLVEVTHRLEAVVNYKGTA